MKNCPLHEECLEYESGDNKPPNHDVRNKYPCSKFIAMSCPALLEILPMVGEDMSCNREEVKVKKTKLRGKK